MSIDSELGEGEEIEGEDSGDVMDEESDYTPGDTGIPLGSLADDYVEEEPVESVEPVESIEQGEPAEQADSDQRPTKKPRKSLPHKHNRVLPHATIPKVYFRQRNLYGSGNGRQ